ncbi:hypothetical protein RHGRI_015081 [Rhododendron griersonianum]|uniref:Uncharacterized protein n=1 Tax=Rhododendron griersonianum TaxID=479676 RepID=A0AAV6KCB8_9ERIC|nr:hypothetical protein RHGRI_015081 [Rhododendron griersonianum]
MFRSLLKRMKATPPDQIVRMQCWMVIASTTVKMQDSKVMFRSLLKRMKATPPDQIVRMQCWMVIASTTVKIVEGVSAEAMR